MKTFRHRLTPSMQLFVFHGILIALEGAIVIISLLTEPSQSGGLLGFSAGRWIVLLVNFLALASVLFVIYKVWKNQTREMELWLSQEKHLFQVFFFAALLFAFSFPAGMGYIPAIRGLVYFGRTQPSLLWLAFASGQVFLTLLFVLRKPIILWFHQFFPEKSVQETSSLSAFQKYFILGFVLVYLSLHVASHFKVRQAIWLPDSIDYIFPAETYAWNEMGLWAHTKPWGVAVLYKLTGTSRGTIDTVQMMLSALAWLALAWIFSRVIFVRWLRVVTFGLILSFGLAPSVRMWNHIIQSESFSISLMVLIIAVWISLLRNWHWAKLFLLILLFGWWIGTRETNVYLSIIVAGILVLVGLFFKRQRFYWAVSAALVGFCVVNMQISELPTIPRWLYPLTNTVLHRILPNEEYLTFFADRGLPLPPELLSLSGGLANSDDFAIFNDSALNDVEDWLYRKGKNTYVQFLLYHPVYTLISPWNHASEILASTEILDYAPAPFLPPVEWIFENFVFMQPIWMLMIFALVTSVVVTWVRPWRTNSFWLIFIFLLLFLPHFYLVWHGDAAEVGRHAIQASVQLRLALWLLLLLALDKIVSNDYRIRTRHRS